jgi:predicted lysophospholipase L1 biosynthesis ABC-type transport system permease subunit
MTQYWRVLACGHAVPKLVVPWPMLLGLVLLALFVLMLVAGFGAPNQAIALLLIGEGFVQFAIGTLSVMRLGTAAGYCRDTWSRCHFRWTLGSSRHGRLAEGAPIRCGAMLVLIAIVRRFREEPD